MGESERRCVYSYWQTSFVCSVTSGDRSMCAPLMMEITIDTVCVTPGRVISVQCQMSPLESFCITLWISSPLVPSGGSGEYNREEAALELRLVLSVKLPSFTFRVKVRGWHQCVEWKYIFALGVRSGLFPIPVAKSPRCSSLFPECALLPCWLKCWKT